MNIPRNSDNNPTKTSVLFRNIILCMLCRNFLACGHRSLEQIEKDLTGKARTTVPTLRLLVRASQQADYLENEYIPEKSAASGNSKDKNLENNKKELATQKQIFIKQLAKIEGSQERLEKLIQEYIAAGGTEGEAIKIINDASKETGSTQGGRVGDEPLDYKTLLEIVQRRAEKLGL